MKKWLSLNSNRIYRKYKMSLNFNLIRKTKLTKIFKLFLENRYLRFKLKAVDYFFDNIKKRRYYSKKRYKFKKKFKLFFNKKRKKKRKLNKIKLLNYYKKKRKKYIKLKNKFFERKYFYEQQYWKKNWLKSITYKLKNSYFSWKGLKLFKNKKKISYVQKKKYFRKRRYFLYLSISALYSKLYNKRKLYHLKKKFNSSKKWLKKNKSFSLYMPESKKKKFKRIKKKSNWWKLRLLNKKVALYYGFTNLKKFRYIFNFYEKGMNFDIKSITRLELMLNMLILSLSFVDNIMTSNNFIRLFGVSINGNIVNYPFRVVKKGSIISIEPSKFKKLYFIMKNRFKRDKTFLLNSFKNSTVRKKKKLEKYEFKKVYKDIVHEKKSKKRDTAWYLNAIKNGAAKLAKARKILERLKDINQKITQDDINFFYDINQDVYYEFEYNKIFDGRFLLKTINVIKNIPKYVEANFKIMHFILWASPNNSQIMKLYRRNHSLNGWNFSTQIENN